MKKKIGTENIYIEFDFSPFIYLIDITCWFLQKWYRDFIRLIGKSICYIKNEHKFVEIGDSSCYDGNGNCTMLSKLFKCKRCGLYKEEDVVI